MKHMKKMVGTLLSVMLLVIISVTAMAASDTTSIKVVGGADGAVYDAYRIFDVTISTNSSAGGDGKTNYAYLVTDTYRDIVKAAILKQDPTADVDEDGKIILYIENMTDDGDDIRSLADEIYTRLVTAGKTPDAVSANQVFSNVKQGYYLIAEKTPGNAQDSYSLVMLGTAGRGQADHHRDQYDRSAASFHWW